MRTFYRGAEEINRSVRVIVLCISCDSGSIFSTVLNLWPFNLMFEGREICQSVLNCYIRMVSPSSSVAFSVFVRPLACISRESALVLRKADCRLFSFPRESKRLQILSNRFDSLWNCIWTPENKRDTFSKIMCHGTRTGSPHSSFTV